MITGTTGMVGKGVLLECLENTNVEKVIVINRYSIELEHPKLIEVIHNNFFELWAIEHYYEECDACFFYLGVSALGLFKE